MTRLESLRKELREAEDKVRSLKEKIRLSDIDQLRKDFLNAGYHEDGEAYDYIKALEACRPWVIKNKHNGGLLCSSESPYGIMMFPTKDKAVPFCDASRCDVVQWEGNQ